MNRPFIKIDSPILAAMISILVMFVCFERSIAGLFALNQELASSLVDEIAVAILCFAAVLVSVSRSSVLRKVFTYAIVFGAYLIVISLLFGVNADIVQVIFQVALHCQFFIIFISLYGLYVHGLLIPTTLLRALMVISIVGAIFQLLLPELFSDLVGFAAYYETSGISRISRLRGFQGNPNALGSALAILIIAMMYGGNRMFFRRQRVLIVYGVLFLVLALTGSRSAFIYILAAYLCLPTSMTKKMLVITLGVSVLFVSGDLQFLIDKTLYNISLTVDSSHQVEYVRWTLLKTGFDLAVDNFPIGTGAATYGSAFSRDSIVYLQEGLASINAFASYNNIHDSNIGTLLGEFGFVGLILFVTFFYYLVRLGINIHAASFLHLPKARKKNIRFIVVLVSIMLISIFLRPFFSSSYYAVLFTLLYLNYIDYWYSE